MQTIEFSLSQTTNIVRADHIQIRLPSQPVRFYRHGWQSWTLATWIHPSTPVVPVRAAEFRLKDEDPVHSMSGKHTSAWVGAAYLGDGEIILLGGLHLGARIQLDSNSLIGFYEADEGEWFIAKGREADVFHQYAELLRK
ncbi:MAG: hypothetical protein AB1649_16725, partial [Chloroflexota bacterium]